METKRMNETHDLLVIFRDGGSSIIPDVEVYGYDSTGRIFWFEKNNMRSFCAVDDIRYFGNYEAIEDVIDPNEE